jgi:epoxyqueuosine reductase
LVCAIIDARTVLPASQLSELVKRAATEAGFDLAGVAPVQDFPELKYFSGWISEHRAGEMHYLEARDEDGELKRTSVARIAPWARSVVVCAISYNTRSLPPVPGSPVSGTDDGSNTNDKKRSPHNERRNHGRISRYAWSECDYHEVLIEKLRLVEARLHAEIGGPLQTHCYVDTGPLIERVYARYAGVGWIGKNTCIINRRLGSYLFLGVLLTSLALSPDLPAPDRCGTCTRCLDTCPTNAFVGPHELDASRCISYLTIEKRGVIPEDLRSGIGLHVFGCDICQDVCPWNRKAPLTTDSGFQPRPGLVDPKLEWLATISQEEFSRVFRGSPVKRAKRSGLRRNAVIAMGNSGDRHYLPLLRNLAADPDEVVAEHARWAIRRLESA